MLRLVVCCGGGMSSSALSLKFQEEIEKKGWQEKVSIAYLPFPALFEQQEKFDIALLCPHLRCYLDMAMKTGGVTIPLYVIPARLYGSMRLQPLVEDAIDAIKLFRETKQNPISFPGEGFLVSKRDTSYRNWIKTHPIKE